MRALRFTIFLLVPLLIIGLGAGFGLWAFKVYRQPNTLPADASIEIARGEGSAAVAEKLEAMHAIPNAFLFRAMGRLTGRDKQIKAGEYLISGLTTSGLLGRMAAGEVIQRKFTIPEGLTSWQVVQRLGAIDTLSGEVATIPPEGSLLPETYLYSKGETRDAKLAQMQDAMRQAVDELWAKRDPNLPLASPEEAVTLASIIEKETGVASERRRVAGVFINRLRAGMKLQTDPTVIYGITGGKNQESGQGPLGRRLLRKDLETDSAYNTYLHEGLPPGPICNPGRAALEAAMNPEKNDYLFFVADGNGGHVFAATIEEQNKNAAEWHRMRREGTAPALQPESATAPEK